MVTNASVMEFTLMSKRANDSCEILTSRESFLFCKQFTNRINQLKLFVCAVYKNELTQSPSVHDFHQIHSHGKR